MRISVRPQTDKSLELEPRNQEIRTLIQLNNNGNCIGYVKEDKLESFLDSLIVEDIILIKAGKNVTIGITIEEFQSYL